MVAACPCVSKVLNLGTLAILACQNAQTELMEGRRWGISKPGECMISREAVKLM
jgi:hypothetical protein